jgi:hypothetical protein
MEMESVLVLGKNPVVGSSYTPPTCNGDADGVATVNVIEGIPSYTYAWQGGGSSSMQLTGLSAGSYSVTVTDSSNCTASITIDVVNPDSLLLTTANSSNPSNCGANDGVARVNATGGVAPYSYFWSNSQNQKNAINLSTGTYDVTVTDGLGCVRTSSVSLIDPNAPTVAGVNSSVTCSHDLGSVAVTVSGGTAPYTYFWNNNSSDSSQMNLPVGIYNVNVVDAAGCLKVTTAEVQGPAHMDVDFNISYGPAGNGDTEIDAVISGANAPYSSYAWRSLRGIFGTTVSGATSNVLSNAVNGDYRIVVEDAQGCLDSAEVSINNLSVGINNASALDQGMKVYPNPSKGKVNLSMNVEAEEAVLRVRDAQGKMVAEKVLANYRGELISIDLTGQAEGLYFVDMHANDQHYVSKVQLTK